MLCSLDPAGSVRIILDTREQALWQTNLPEAHSEIQKRAIHLTHEQGLDGEIRLYFMNGAQVCTIRLVESYLLHPYGVNRLD